MNWFLSILLPRLLPGFMEKLMGFLPKGEGTYTVAGLTILSSLVLAALNTYDSSLGVTPEAAGGTIAGALLIALNRRGSMAAEKAAEEAKAAALQTGADFAGKGNRSRCGTGSRSPA